VFFGAWKIFPLVTTLAIWGALMIGAIYMTRAIRNILHGPLPEKFSHLADASNLWRKLPYALLLASLLIFGAWPKLLTNQINPDAEKIAANFSNANVQPDTVLLKTENLKLNTSNGNRQLAIENK
jgi:NADH:ubiquinone oxidoreductase subunit 4 (subunit M)